MLGLEAGAWNTSQAPPGNTPQQRHPPSGGASVRGLDSSHSEVSFLPVPRCPGLSTLLDASLVFTFLLPLFLCRPHPPPQPWVHSEETRGSAPGLHSAPAGEAPTPGWRGWEGFYLFLFLLRFPPLSQFSFPPCGISLPPSHPGPVPTTGRGWEQRRGWDSVFHGWFLLIIWITARNQE